MYRHNKNNISQKYEWSVINFYITMVFCCLLYSKYYSYAIIKIDHDTGFFSQKFVVNNTSIKIEWALQNSQNITYTKMLRIQRHATPPIFESRSVEYTKKENQSIRQVNEYVLLEKIGTGSTSKIFYAFDTRRHIPVAVKVLKKAEGNRPDVRLQYLDRELRNLSRFHHSNILGYKEALYSEALNQPYIVLEYADAGSLSDYIAHHGPLSENKLASVFKQIISAVLYLHSNGVAHKDIKPSNILLKSDGTAKLSDLGIGHTFQSADSVVGSPAYQAPEIFGDDEEEYEEDSSYVIDPIKEDVWSLGVSIYEVAFGYLPFTGSNEFEIARAARETELAIPETASEHLRSLLQGMLCLKPEDRLSLMEVDDHPFFTQNVEKYQFEAIPVVNREANGDVEQIEARTVKPMVARKPSLSSFHLEIPQYCLITS